MSTHFFAASSPIRGAISALITPFHAGAVDEKLFARFVEWQIAEGIDGMVPCGTTGESPTLDHDEHQRVIALCVEVVKKRVPVIAGTGSNSTKEAIGLTQYAEKVGADASLQIVPYYNKPTQEGLFQHFKAVHDNTSLPIILYNVPGRTVADLKNETIQRIVEDCPRVVGIKDATADLARPKDLKARLGKREFLQISGEDATAVEFNQAGGVGVISVSSNVAPKACAEIQKLCRDGAWDQALAKQKALLALHDVMFCETSPAPVKYALSLMGFGDGSLRLPLVPPTDASKQKIRAVLESLQLI